MTTEDRIEAAVELALATLAQVAATGSNDEKVKASVALLQGAQVAWEGARKAAVTSRVLPLLEAVGKNLAGQLSESDPYAPFTAWNLASRRPSLWPWRRR